MAASTGSIGHCRGLWLWIQEFLAKATRGWGHLPGPSVGGMEFAIDPAKSAANLQVHGTIWIITNDIRSEGEGSISTVLFPDDD